MAIIGYVLIAVVGRPVDKVEFYPFFNWHLFSNAHTPMMRAEFRIHAIDGQTFAEPHDYFALDEVFADAAARDTRVAKAAMRWANAIASGDSATQNKMRAIFETHHIRRPGVDYELVVTRFDPIERYKTGKVIDQKILGRFST